MNQDNNNSQPLNYDFITAQGGLEDAKKPKDKKLVIIFILVVVTLLMIIFLVLATQNSTKEVSGTNEIVAAKHIRLITEGNFSEAIKLHAGSQEISEEVYGYFWGSVMTGRYDFAKCDFTKNPEKVENSFIYRVECPLKSDAAQNRVIKYKIANSTGFIESITDLGDD
jgi:hypothetical protein